MCELGEPAWIAQEGNMVSSPWHFIWEIKELFENSAFSVSEGVLLNTLKLFSAKCFLIFLNIYQKLFWTNSIFFANNALILFQKYNFYCKAPKKFHAFLILPKKSFSVFNRAPSHTLKVFFSKIFYFFFSMSITSVFYINSKILFQQYTDVVTKY